MTTITATWTYVVRLTDPQGEADTQFVGPFDTAKEARAYVARFDDDRHTDAYVETVCTPR